MPITVQSGDTLGAIAARAGLSLGELLALPGNAGFRDNPDLIQPGQVVATGGSVAPLPANVSGLFDSGAFPGSPSTVITRRGPDDLAFPRAPFKAIPTPGGRDPFPRVQPQPLPQVKLFVPPLGTTFDDSAPFSGPNRDIMPQGGLRKVPGGGGLGGFVGTVTDGLTAPFGAFGGGGGGPDLSGLDDALGNFANALGDALAKTGGGLGDFAGGVGDVAGDFAGGVTGILDNIPLFAFALIGLLALVLVVGFRSDNLSARVSR